MSRQTTVARVQELAERAVEGHGIEIVEVELKGAGRNHLLRIYIDKPDGVTHGDCETVSAKLGALLDAEDALSGNYTLEVSSPGVERKLKKPADFARFQGKKARLVIREADRGNRLIEGTLSGTTAEDSGSAGVIVETSGGERVHVPFESIDRANLKFEW